MLNLFGEGIESILLPCSWIVVIPAVVMTIAGRHRTSLVMICLVAVSAFVAWLRFAGWWFAVPNGLTQVALGMLIIILSIAAWRFDRGVADAALSAAVATATVWTWIPCVGPHLGDLLNESQSDPVNHIGGTLAFVLGLSVPSILIFAVGLVWPATIEKINTPRVVSVSLVACALIGVAFATTTIDDLASELARRSAF